MPALCLKPHDLVRYDPDRLIGQNLPGWVPGAMQRASIAVVRRSQQAHNLLPIGIRGVDRHQRWGGWLAYEAILEYFTPESLVDRICELPRSRVRSIPALAALVKLEQRMQGIPFIWGATGSIGFELASGLPTANGKSDLDVLVRCPEPIGQAEISRLSDLIKNLDARCDLSLETPFGSVALLEFARGNACVAMKTTSGPILTSNPWSGETA